MRQILRELVTAIQEPQTLSAQSPERWSQLIRTARRANLLGRLAYRVDRHQLTPIPEARRHLSGARQLCERQVRSVRWEVHCLHQALAGVNTPIVLLKGAAYVMGGHSVAQGRLFGDVDVLVPAERLAAVESALMLAGWDSLKADLYDQRYYREWMHELPPMVHFKRGTVVDVHHRILPVTAKHAPDPTRIFDDAYGLPGLPGFWLPSAADLLVHSCTHLVHEGELDNGLRDVLDIDGMIDEFADQPGFWSAVVRASAGNDLAGPVGFALHLCRRIAGSRIPDEVLSELRGAPGSSWQGRWLESMFEAAMSAKLGQQPAALQEVASWWVYVRAHRMRMPGPLLARHLATKAWRGLRGRIKTEPD